jgi:hypothetical protein
MRKIKYIVLSLVFILSGCDYGDLNENPNEPVQVPETLLLTGTMLANISVNSSHINRISGMWSGQYRGLQSLYQAIYNYNISTEESNSSWGYLYNGIIAQNDVIQKGLANDKLIIGITKIIEAHAVGTACSNWGKIPYSEAAKGIDDPAFDPQANVFKQLQDLLDEAIADLNGTNGYNLSQDIFFNGNKTKWLQTAYTLKARYYMLTKEYDKAYTAAQQGISSGSNSMKYNPPGTTNGDQNLIFEMLSGSRQGDMGTTGTYLSTLIGTTASSRNNVKTNEDARSKYYYINENGNTTGIAAAKAPMPLVTFEENLLTLAETAARTKTFAEALGYLNQCRAYLASGAAFTKVNAADVLKYDAYVTSDFNAGGMENTDNINPTRALLREIIQERYVSGFGTFMPWNDARRLRKSDTDVAVPFPLNTTSVSTYPERFKISQNELNSNPNAPKGVTIFDKTEVNQ